MSIEDIRALIGREVGVSEWQLLDQQRIDQFAACTGDDQWIHVDTERARAESPLQTTIAHGYLTLSLVAKSSFDVFIAPAGIRQALNYGLEKVRFIAPVRAGARVRNRISLISVEDKGNGTVLLRTANTIEIEGETKPALVADAMVLAFA